MKTTLLTLVMLLSVATIVPANAETYDSVARREAVLAEHWDQWEPLFESWATFDADNFQAPPRILVEFLTEAFLDLYVNEFDFDLVTLLTEAGYDADVFTNYIERIVNHLPYAEMYIRGFGVGWIEMAIQIALEELLDIYEIGGMDGLMPFFTYMYGFEAGTDIELPEHPVWVFTAPTREEVEEGFLRALYVQDFDFAEYIYQSRGLGIQYLIDYIHFYLTEEGENYARMGRHWLASFMADIVFDIRHHPEALQMTGLLSTAISVLGVERAVYFFDELFLWVAGNDIIRTLYANPDFAEILEDFTQMDQAFLMQLFPDMIEEEQPPQSQIFEIGNDIWITITQADLEVRHSFPSPRATWYLFDGSIEGAALNVFFLNQGQDVVYVTLLAIDDATGQLEYFNEIVPPGRYFVMQVPDYLRAVDIKLLPENAGFGGYIPGELGFRFTHGSINQ